MVARPLPRPSGPPIGRNWIRLHYRPVGGAPGFHLGRRLMVFALRIWSRVSDDLLLATKALFVFSDRRQHYRLGRRGRHLYRATNNRRTTQNETTKFRIIKAIYERVEQHA